MSDSTYDYVIVGAGSAGCVLANRLSEDPRRRVLLLEAGPPRHWLSRIPISFSKLIDDPSANWCYRATPEPGMDDRPIPIPRGRVLGGSSAINGLVYVRGQPLDYDTWAQRGNRGWSYADLLPTFRAMERYAGGDEALRGRDGPLKVSEATDRGPLYDALFRAGEEVGLPRNPDYNGASQEGVCTTQVTIDRGRRMSAAHCYLEPARRRANLQVRTGALAHALHLDAGRCAGVRYAANGELHEAEARREVILAAGSINSPQLLELSGIGQPEVLEAQEIAVRHALPGVGENLRDHVTPRLRWRINGPGLTYNDRAQGLGLLWQIARYAVDRKGFLNLPSGPMLAFFRTRPELESPDIQLHFVPFLVAKIANKRELDAEPGLTIACYQLRPESTGSVHIASPDPAAPPSIRCNFLDDPLDRETTLAGVRFTRRLIGARAMDAIRGEELAPGPERESDEALLEWIRATAETAYHPVGTCKMGQDPMAVVDERLRVRGIEGLRVADGSIMPTLISGNTNAPCIMIGERASAMVLEDAAGAA